jgi:hypothetical protein
MKTKNLCIALLINLLLVVVAIGQSSKEYTIADLAEFETDLVAGTYDTLILATSGGVYNLQNYNAISKSTVIMGKEGLEQKPVMKRTNNTGTGAGLFLATGDDIRVEYRGLAFDGTIVEGTNLISAFRANSKVDMVVRDCTFENFTDNNGVFRLNTGGSTIDIRHSLIANSKQRLIHLYTPNEVYGHIHLENCTFVNIDGPVVLFRSASGSPAIGTSLTVNHCTFYNINSPADGIIKCRGNMQGEVKIENAVFANITAGTELVEDAVPVVDYCYVAGMDPVVSGTNLFETAPLFLDADNLNFAITNAEAFICGDGEVAGDLSYYEEEVEEPRTMEYTVEELAAFEADLVAGIRDTLILSTPGGIYNLQAYNRISTNTVIMGKEGLEEKPILKRTNNTGSGAGVFLAIGDGITVVYKNLSFDGTIIEGTNTISGLRANSRINLIVQDCYFENFTDNNGVFRFNTGGSTMDIRNSVIANSKQRLIHLYTPGEVYGHVHVENCTFVNIDGPVIFYRAAGGDNAIGTTVTVNHATFYHVNGGADGIIRGRNNFTGDVRVENSVFFNISAGTPLINGGVAVVDYCYVAGMDPVVEGTNLFGSEPVFADVENFNFAITNANEFICGDGEVVGDLSHYSEVTEWNITFVVQTTGGVLIEDAVVTFNGVAGEAGDYVFTVAEAGNYAYRVDMEPKYVWRGGNVTVPGDETVLVELADRKLYAAKYLVEPLIVGTDNSDIWALTAGSAINIVNDPIGAETDSQGVIKAAYDNEFLYIYAKIQDDVLVYADPENWRAGGGDEFEVYIDGKNGFKPPAVNSRPRFDPGKYQMSFGLGLDSLRGWGEGDGANGTIHDFSMMYAHGVDWVQQDADGGMVLEARIPWMAIYQGDADRVASLAPGDYVSVNFNIRDYDVLGVLSTQVVWEEHPYMENNQFNNHPFSGSQHWGVIQLLPSVPTVVFNVVDEEGAAITDAVITFGDQTNEPGEYIFAMELGTYDYRVNNEPGYIWKGGSIVLESLDMVTVDVVMARRASYEARYIPSPIQIGAESNADIWVNIAPEPITTLNQLMFGDLSSEGTFRSMYDDSFLYLMMEIVDDKLVYTQDWTTQNADEIEFYIDGKNSFSRPGPTTSRPRFEVGKYQMGFQLGADTLRGWGETDGTTAALPHVFDVMYQYGAEFVQQPTAYGYMVEARLPWMAIYQENADRVASLAPGDYVSVNFNIRDYEVHGELKSQVVWVDHPYQTSQLNNHPFWGSQHWGVILLSADTVESLPQYSVVFNITDGAGNLVDGATVQLGTMVNPAGNYTFSAVGGSYFWQITREGYYPKEGNIQVAGETTVDVVLEKIPTYTVTFNVVNQFGNAISGAVFTYKGTPYPAGQYVFEGQQPGSYVYFAAYNGLMTAGVVNVEDKDVAINVVFTTDETGITDVFGDAFNMYPNPLGTGNLTIEIPKAESRSHLKIIDLKGSVMYVETIPEGVTQIHLTKTLFDKGVYFVHLEQDQQFAVRKLIVY